MAREDVRMSPEEVDGFLSTQTRAVVVAGGAPDAPEGAVGRLRYTEGTVGFVLHEDDPVAGLLAEDDRACCVVEQFPSYFEIKGVMLHGRARRQRGGAAGEATYHLVVEKVVSFDFGKLSTATRAGSEK